MNYPLINTGNNCLHAKSRDRIIYAKNGMMESGIDDGMISQKFIFLIIVSKMPTRLKGRIFKKRWEEETQPEKAVTQITCCNSRKFKYENLSLDVLLPEYPFVWTLQHGYISR